jgi:alpha-mannosidase
MKHSAVIIIMILNMAFAKDPGIILKNHSNSNNERVSKSNVQNDSLLKIVKVEPTVLFRNEQNVLMQAVDMSITNAGDPVDITLKVRFLSQDELSIDLGTIKTGENQYRFFVPEVSDPVPVELALVVVNKVQDHLTINWTPRKHWEVCLIPISHHDIGYTATIEHVMRNYQETYTDVIKFCEETENYPDEAKFRYSVEESWSLQHFIEKSDKETLDKLAKYIKEGRIEVQALYAELTTNMSSHEELIRLLYPSFRINKEFGGQIKVGSITDIPGLSWGLPSILAGAGVNYFFGGMPTYFEWYNYKQRYGEVHTFWDEKNILRPHGRPDAFYWTGPDGSKVLVYYQGSYGCWSPESCGYGCWGPASCDQVLNELPGKLSEMDVRGNPFSVMRFAGYGCGDNTKTDILVSNLVKEWNSRWAYPKLIVSTNSMFFEKLEKQCKDLRTFTGDLPDTDYPVGAVSMAKETATNRVTHDRISSAEKIATMSHILLNSKYPSNDIRDAYNNMMLYDEHCWGMSSTFGDVQDWANREKGFYAYRASGLTELILDFPSDVYNQAAFKSNARNIANSIAFNAVAQHIVVFNPLSFKRNDLVNVPNFMHKEPFDIIDIETGEKIPHQVIVLESPQSPVPHAAERYAGGQINPPDGYNLAFVAENVPSMGYKTYRIVPAQKSSIPSTILMLTDRGIENRFFKVTLNPKTGTVTSIYDKELKIELVDNNAPHQVNQLITRWIKTGKEESPKVAVIRKGQNGPVYASLVVSTSGAGCPEVTQEIILYDKIKRIDFNNRVLKNMTPTQEVYFAFPFRMDNPDFRFEGPLSVIKPLKDQFPGSNSNYYSVQHWADVSDGKTGITISPVDAHLIMFGGLNTSEISQAHHAVKPVTFGAPFVTEMKKGYMYSFVMNNNFRTNMPPTQLGDILFRYSVTSHKGNWLEGCPRDFGWAVKNPLIPVPVISKNNGKLPLSLSFCEVDKPNVILLTMKKAEDDTGIIIRLNETEGRDTEVNVTLPEMTIRKVYETNIVEENEKLLEAQGQTIKINIKAFGIKTIRIM